MSLSDQLLQIWRNQDLHISPRIPLLFYNSEYMATIDDAGVLLRFMGPDGQIYSALNTQCQYAQGHPSIGDQVYVCTSVKAILCAPAQGPENSRDVFVMKYILPHLI